MPSITIASTAVAPLTGAAEDGSESGLSVGDVVSEGEWDAYIGAHPLGTIDHAFRWRRVFEEVFGHRTMYLAAREGESVVGVLPLVLFNSRLFGRFLVSVPFLNYGGLLVSRARAAQALIARAGEIGREFGAAHIELRHTARQLPHLPCRQHKLQLTRALPSTSEGLWADVDKKVRNQVRKAQKDGLVAETGGAELVDAFYDVFATNMRDLGTPVYSRRLFSEALRLFPTEARVHVVRLGKLPVAASITFRRRDTVLVPWASSLRAYRQHCPNMLLYWTMLEQATLGGAHEFDFGRSSPGGGTHQFKLQWGAAEAPLHWEYVLLTATRVPDQGPQNPKFSAAIDLWKRLPVLVTNRLGPLLVRNIP